MKELIIENILTILQIMGVLAIFWVSNMSFSLWHNIKDLQEGFDKKKLIDGLIKLAVLLIGTLTLSIGLTTLFAFVDKTGFVFEGYSEELSVGTIVVIYGTTCVYYGGQAILALKDIFAHKLNKTEITGEDI